MARSKAKRHHRHDLDCRPRDHRGADTVVGACTSALHPVAVQRPSLRRLKVGDLETTRAHLPIASSVHYCRPRSFRFPHPRFVTPWRYKRPDLSLTRIAISPMISTSPSAVDTRARNPHAVGPLDKVVGRPLVRVQ